MLLALKGLDDGFDKGGGFAGSRRAVDDGNLLCFDYLLDGILLAGVEPGEREPRQGAEMRLKGAYEGVAQVDETLVVAAHGCAEGVEHHLIAGGVYGSLDAKQFGLCRCAERLEGGAGGDGDREYACAHLFDVVGVRQFAEGTVVVGQ